MLDFIVVLFLCLAVPWAVYQVTKTDEPAGKDSGLYCPLCGQRVKRKG